MRATTRNVRGLIINSPSNPTGAVYTRNELESIVRWAAERNVWVVSDEIYTRLSYDDGPATSVLHLPDDILHTTVLVDGASKSFAMTGWRIGFSYCAPKLAEMLGALQSHITSNSSTPSQYAALAAYKAVAPQDEAARAMARHFHQRRDLLLQVLEQQMPGRKYVHPSGAFYLFLRVDDKYTTECNGSIALCAKLLDDAGVALVPGAAFGEDRFVRLSFAASDQAVAEGVRRIASVLNA
jgi:aspartate aminotransferase